MAACALAGLAAGLRALAAGALAVMAVLVTAQVALRYLGGGAPAFTEEMARYAMIWSALLAAAVAVREGTHIRVDLLPGLIGRAMPGLARALARLLEAVTLLVLVILAWQGLDMVAFAHGARSEGLQLRLSYPYAVLPAAFACASLFAAARLFARR
ncbi:MAG: TRAP transporter small permease [Alphaproteobacteria bacterium]|nr:MAG: TRAP transporter small permease [Alphaproteobacteria bacterium]